MNKFLWIVLVALIVCKMIGWITVSWLPIIIYGVVITLINIFGFVFIVVIAAIISYLNDKDE